MPTLEPPTDSSKSKEWNRLPPQTVFALFEDEPVARMAQTRLTRVGVPEENVRVLSGADGSAVLQPGGETAASDFLSQALAALTDETKYFESYATKVRAGRSLVAVRFETPDDRKTIEAILLDSGGADMTYTSDWTITVVGSGWTSS